MSGLPSNTPNLKRWLTFFNNSLEFVPPYGVIQLESPRSDTTSTIDYLERMRFIKPDGSAGVNGTFALNTRVKVLDQRDGQCTFGIDAPVWGRIETDSGNAEWPVTDPTLNWVGQEWGPVSGRWDINIGGKGFIIQGPPDITNNRILVRQRPFGTAGDLGKDCICCPDCSCCPTDPAVYTDACSPFPKLYKNYLLSGKSPYGGYTLVWSSGCIFYSPSFNMTICGTDYGSHRWKWTAAEPIDTSVLELEGVGSTYTGLTLRYKNKWHYDPWCGSDFGILERWTFPCAVAHDPPKVLCISPSAAICGTCSTPNACCPAENIPGILHMTEARVSPPTSACNALNAITTDLNYNASTGKWEREVSVICGPPDFSAIFKFTFEIYLVGGSACFAKMSVYQDEHLCAQEVNAVTGCGFTGVTFHMSWTSAFPFCTCCNQTGFLFDIVISI
jgi:hypothetical protein